MAMNNIDGGKELGRAVIAGIVAFFVAIVLKALNAGKWMTAAGSGAVGGMVAVAIVA
jgi:hypothetical protein